MNSPTPIDDKQKISFCKISLGKCEMFPHFLWKRICIASIIRKVSIIFSTELNNTYRSCSFSRASIHWRSYIYSFLPTPSSRRRSWSISSNELDASISEKENSKSEFVLLFFSMVIFIGKKVGREMMDAFESSLLIS